MGRQGGSSAPTAPARTPPARRSCKQRPGTVTIALKVVKLDPLGHYTADIHAGTDCAVPGAQVLALPDLYADERGVARLWITLPTAAGQNLASTGYLLDVHTVDSAGAAVAASVTCGPIKAPAMKAAARVKPSVDGGTVKGFVAGQAERREPEGGDPPARPRPRLDARPAHPLRLLRRAGRDRGAAAPTRRPTPTATTTPSSTSPTRRPTSSAAATSTTSTRRPARRSVPASPAATCGRRAGPTATGGSRRAGGPGSKRSAPRASPNAREGPASAGPSCVQGQAQSTSIAASRMSTVACTEARSTHSSTPWCPSPAGPEHDRRDAGRGQDRRVHPGAVADEVRACGRARASPRRARRARRARPGRRRTGSRTSVMRPVARKAGSAARAASSSASSSACTTASVSPGAVRRSTCSRQRSG